MPLTLTLATDIGIANVEAVKDDLVAGLTSAEAVILDARDLQRIDTAGIQLLCAFVREAARRQCPVRWVAPSETLRESATLLGVAQTLGLAPTSPGSSV